MLSGGFEFVPDKTETEKPCSECVPLVSRNRYPRRSRSLRESLIVYRKAKLYVRLELTRVSGAVEKPELYRTLGKNRVKIESVVAAAVVVRIS